MTKLQFEQATNEAKRTEIKEGFNKLIETAFQQAGITNSITDMDCEEFKAMQECIIYTQNIMTFFVDLDAKLDKLMEATTK